MTTSDGSVGVTARSAHRFRMPVGAIRGSRKGARRFTRLLPVFVVALSLVGGLGSVVLPNSASADTFWSPQTGEHDVHGAILEKWASLGWERGFLGYPLTDETITPDGIGRYNHFQGGSVYWTPTTGAHEVHG